MKDFRIGNLILIEGNITEIKNIPLKGDVRLININPNILNSLGFIKNSDSLYERKDIRIMFYEGFYEVYVANNYNTLFKIRNIKYLHELQNIYYLLNGKDICTATIKGIF